MCDDCCQCDPYLDDDFTCSACKKAWREYDELRAALDLRRFISSCAARQKYSASRRTLKLNSVLVRLVEPIPRVRSAIRIGPIDLVMGPGLGIRYHGRYGTYPVVYADSKTRQWFDLIPQRQLSLKETVLLLMSVANRLPDVEPVVMTRMVCLPLIMRLLSLPDDVSHFMRDAGIA